MSIRQAVEQAVTECINEGIPADFFEKSRAEVMNMSIQEIDEERIKEMFRRDGYENGFGDDRDTGEIASKVEDILNS